MKKSHNRKPKNLKRKIPRRNFFKRRSSGNKFNINLLLVILVAFVVWIWGSSNPVSENTILSTYGETSPASNYEDMNNEIEKYVLIYTNEERNRYGYDNLVFDGDLTNIARAHSEDMSENSYFSHTNLKGQDPTDRAVNYGYSIKKYISSNSYSMGIGENIAKMPTGNVQGYGYVEKKAEKIARAIVDEWMDSPGHKSNILDSTYTNIGVGVSYDGKYYICTQNFW